MGNYFKACEKRVNGGIVVPKFKSGDRVAEDVMAKQVAAYAIMGMSNAEIARKLGIPPKGVARIKDSEQCKLVMLRIGEEAVKTAKEEIKKTVALMAPLFLDGLKKHLQEGNEKVYGHFLKIVGFQDNEQQQGDTSITVVLPSAPEEPKNVTHEAQD